MLTPTILHHRSVAHSLEPYVPVEFGLLNWNVHKQNLRNPCFRHFLTHVMEEKALDFLTFQEASLDTSSHCLPPEFAFDAAANLEWQGRFYGVLTASHIEAVKVRASLSRGREGGLGTRKSMMASRYTFADGTSLLLLNIHAINFRETRHYARELELLFELANDHVGPLILTGDFNSWNRRRTQRLDALAARLDLRAVPFSPSHRVTAFLGYPLDHVFYRDLRLLEHDTLDVRSLSDHTALRVRFGL